MRRAIREHSRDFIAIILLLLLSLAVLFAILSQQRANFPDWLPFLGEDKFQLKAEFTSAQAVTPGQGQTVQIAGIRVGGISDVELDQGVAVVTMEVDPEYASVINEDATYLLRPRTGLQDMTIDIDTGTSEGPPIEEGALVPSAQTAPNVNPDEVLASLDADTRAFLRLLLADGAKALGGRGEEFSAVLRRFEPTVRDIAKFQGALASRRANLSKVIHDFGSLVEELGMRDDQVKRFVNSSNEVLASFANQEEAIQESLREFPSTLEETRTTLASSEEFANIVGPASRDLVPAAQALAPALREVQPFFRETVGPIRDQIRPATREIGEPIRRLNTAAKGLAASTPALSSSFQDLNILFNEIAYNPPGAQDEGFLFWISWLNHNVNAVSTLQDANGPLLRGIVMITCGNTRLAEQVANQRPFLRLLYDATLTPTSSEICPPSNLPFRGDAQDEDAGGQPDAPEESGETTTTEDTTTTTTTPDAPTPDPAAPGSEAEEAGGTDVAEGQDSGEEAGAAGDAAGSDIPPKAGP
jgi:phospholipid/cholesterol/gamma-HCH transport system substrate-binding protein